MLYGRSVSRTVHYEHRAAVCPNIERSVALVERKCGESVPEDWFRAYRKVRRDLLDIERRTIVDLRDRDEINDEALRSIQRELDLEQVRLDAGDQ